MNIFPSIYSVYVCVWLDCRRLYLHTPFLHRHLSCPPPPTRQRHRSERAMTKPDPVPLGTMLKSYYSEEGMPLQNCALLAIHLLEKVDILHGKGFAHRGISPSNILIGRNLSVKVYPPMGSSLGCCFVALEVCDSHRIGKHVRVVGRRARTADTRAGIPLRRRLLLRHTALTTNISATPVSCGPSSTAV